ncbi:MAG: DUF835 domain-containing protein [Thermoplasmata archaeon]|nr:DUF835 domain-containing protein [Thermoplasmata archaeon]
MDAFPLLRRSGFVGAAALAALLLLAAVPDGSAPTIATLLVAGPMPLQIPGGNGTLDPDRMATMFFLLFSTSLVGLYIASRYLKRKGSGFSQEVLGRTKPKAERVIELEPGEAYLVTQGQNRAMKVFTQELSKGHPGLCITRTYPDKLKESWDLDGSKVYWLTDEGTKAKGAVRSLADMEARVDKFLEGEEKGIILLDGLEYLFVQYSFTEVMKLLQGMRDAMPATGARLIIPIDLLALVRRQRALLTREFRQL